MLYLKMNESVFISAAVAKGDFISGYAAGF
jgi:hypothetical protein